MNTIFDWTVVGAGPAGIACIGKLLDFGIHPEKIAWIDPFFKVGDLGQKWKSVPSNTKVRLFLKFLNASQAFQFKDRPTPFYLESLDADKTCLLKDVVEPLQWITDHLIKKVRTFQTKAIGLNLARNLWEIKTLEGLVYTKNGILAIGSESKSLPFKEPLPIDLETVLDLQKLQKTVSSQDTIAVFGSSHSAILALANLVELQVKKVINFYRSPLRYAVDLDGWILFDDTGLKGFGAKWAKKHIDGTFPHNLQRVLLSDPAFDEIFALCTKAVYAIGFEKRKLPLLEQYPNAKYDPQTGIIAPHLFGCGIAFPQESLNRLGQLEKRVGLWKFMNHLNTLLPIWLQSANF